MTQREMHEMMMGLAELFREYMGQLSDDVQSVYAIETSERGNAEHVFRDLIAWLERDNNGG